MPCYVLSCYNCWQKRKYFEKRIVFVIRLTKFDFRGGIKMQGRQRRHWAFLADRKRFEIEESIHSRREEYWTDLRAKTRAGDRAIIWKAKGGDAHRGIIALAEILTDPVPMPDDDDDEYVRGQGPPHMGEFADRVKVRYWIPPVLPLWEDGEHSQFLQGLKVARAHGGTLFHVTPDQWDTILELVGGWPVKDSEIEDAK